MSQPIVVLGAPSAIGLRPYDHGGVRRLDVTPGVLREQGLADRLGASDLGDVIPPPRYVDLVRPSGRGRNEEDVATYSEDLANRIAPQVVGRRFVLLLGGDCSIMLGALLALRRAGRTKPGLVYIDAHADFATLDESPSGSACSMNLALAVGRSDTPLARLDDEPLLGGKRVVHIGRRDEAQPEYGYPALQDFGILDLPQTVVDRHGVEAVAARALERVGALDAGFWIHFDVDVLDPRLMPAVDSPLAGGFDIEMAATLLAALVAAPGALGLQLTIYDPTIDSDRSGAPLLADLLERVLVGQGSI